MIVGYRCLVAIRTVLSETGMNDYPLTTLSEKWHGLKRARPVSGIPILSSTVLAV